MKKITINRNEYQIEDKYNNSSLLYYLREVLDLTGTKNGCGKGFCGSCTIILNRKATKSCNLLISQIPDGSDIITIEGMENPDGTLSPIQQAFVDHGAIQCGFCTPAMVLTAHAFLMNNSNPTREEIRKAISPNLCRCTGYQQIIEAIEAAAKYYQQKDQKALS